jgi:hypothetical protein
MQGKHKKQPTLEEKQRQEEILRRQRIALLAYEMFKRNPPEIANFAYLRDLFQKAESFFDYADRYSQD